MSRATIENPITPPDASQMGEMSTETSTMTPSRRRQRRSKGDDAPVAIFAMRPTGSPPVSSDASTSSDFPIISSAARPKIFSAARFQSVTTPSSVPPMMASSEEATMAA